MANKFGDVRWKWLSEKGYNVLSDKHQYAYMQSLWSPVELVTGIFCEARAGTGKTTLATLAAAYEVEKGTYDKIIYVRNTIPIRDQGFLPGELASKQEPYMKPFISALDKVQPGLFEKWSTPEYKKEPKVFLESTSFARGIEWDNAFIIIDEVQNLELEELNAVYTRPTDSCKVVSIGSLRQVDNKKLKKYGGLTPFEVYMEHFKGQRVTYHKLETNYRGWFSNFADDIRDTVDKLNNISRNDNN